MAKRDNRERERERDIQDKWSLNSMYKSFRSDSFNEDMNKIREYLRLFERDPDKTENEDIYIENSTLYSIKL